MVKSVFSPHHKRDVKFGRKATPFRPALHLANYVRGEPAAPASCDYTAKAPVSLSDIYGNDTLGDCVIAMMLHLYGAWTGNAGSEVHFTEAQAIKLYSAIGGYVPGNEATDQGCDIGTALQYFQSTGYPDAANGKLLGSVAINANDAAEMKLATFLFEGIACGAALPDAWVNNMPSRSGWTWDKAGAPDENNGHAFGILGYDTSGRYIITTWGMLGYLTPAAASAYLTAAHDGELHVPITEAMIAKGETKAPNGIDWDALIADFNEIGGDLPVPAPAPPSPAPAPTPAPSPAPAPGAVLLSLADAQVAMSKGWPQTEHKLYKELRLADAQAQLAKGWPQGTVKPHGHR